MELREEIEREAHAAKRAAASLARRGGRGGAALGRRARARAAGGDPRGEPGRRRRRRRPDEAMLDRLRLDEARVDGLAAQVEALAELEPLAREVDAWTLANGLRVSERRIPIGAVGANFEARPGVALDVAGQLLKSLNAAVLRTGGAALRTVTVLVDEVLRPALDVGRAAARRRSGSSARPTARAPARSSRSRRLIPLVILRGSGETTAALARLAAENGVRTLAHAEGGGVLYVHAEARSRDRLLAIVAASVDRLGVCNRLNLCLVDRRCLRARPRSGRAARGARPRGARRRRGRRPLDVPIGHEWANDPNPSQVTVCYVDSLEEAVRIANEETSALAAGIVTEDPVAAQALPRRLSRHGGVLERDDAVHGRVRADGRAGDGDQRRLDAGPARAGHVPRPVAAAVPRRRRRHADAVKRAGRRQARLVARRRAGRARAAVGPAGARRARSPGSSAAARRSASSRPGAIALGLPRLGLAARPRSAAEAAGRLGARAGAAPARLGRGARREGLAAAQVLLTAIDVADRAAYLNARNALAALFALGAVPVVNENDATATDEITFGDNDALAAQVAILVRARLLVLLTEVEGVYSRAPGTPGRGAAARSGPTRARPSSARARRSARAACRARSLAAELAASAGIPTVIAAGTGRGRARADRRRRAARHAFPAGRALAVRVQALAPPRQAGRGPDPRRRRRAPRALATDGASLLAVGVAACRGPLRAGRRRRARRLRRLGVREGHRRRRRGRAHGPAARRRGGAPRPARSLLSRAPQGSATC